MALCSIGPIHGLMVPLLLYPRPLGPTPPVSIPEVPDIRAPLGSCLRRVSPEYIVEVALCLAPIAAFCRVSGGIPEIKKKKVLKIVVGIPYTYIGLVLFLTGVNVGFMSAWQLSEAIASPPCPIIVRS